jgi:hypothetical protein
VALRAGAVTKTTVYISKKRTDILQDYELEALGIVARLIDERYEPNEDIGVEAQAIKDFVQRLSAVRPSRRRPKTADDINNTLP